MRPQATTHAQAPLTDMNSTLLHMGSRTQPRIPSHTHEHMSCLPLYAHSHTWGHTHAHTHIHRADAGLLFTKVGVPRLQDGSTCAWSLREGLCYSQGSVPRRRVPARPTGRPDPGLAGLQPQWDWIAHQESEEDGPLYTDLVPCLGVKAAAQGCPETQLLSLWEAGLVSIVTHWKGSSQTHSLHSLPFCLPSFLPLI